MRRTRRCKRRRRARDFLTVPQLPQNVRSVGTWATLGTTRLDDSSFSAFSVSSCALRQYVAFCLFFRVPTMTRSPFSGVRYSTALEHMFDLRDSG